MDAPQHDDPLSSAHFRRLGHALVDRLAAHLDDARARTMPVLPPVDLHAELERWRVSAKGGANVVELLADVVARSNHLHHPGFVGHQVAVPHPVAALCELVAGLMNNGMAVYEMGPAATAIERSLVRWLASELRFPAGADGFFTSGGTAGNLTALLAARELRSGFAPWERGQHAGEPLCLLVGDEAHYSVARAAQIMGWGRDGAWRVPCDERFRMRADALPAALAAARARGRKVVAVVASACSTATGAFDPLEAIADFCAQEKLWMHVDGAHGGAVALSERLRPKVAGIERADSVVVDAHKMLAVPALSTAVLFREGAHSYASFAQEASYIFTAQGADRTGSRDQAVRTFECTKRMLALPLYALLETYGREALVAHVERCFDLATSFAELLRAQEDFELAVEPEANIVCFRHRARGLEAESLDALQDELRERVLATGRFYLVKTRLKGRTWLRTTLLNPSTTLDDLRALVELLRDLARDARKVSV